LVPKTKHFRKWHILIKETTKKIKPRLNDNYNGKGLQAFDGFVFNSALIPLP
jgi:hypothetical protein